MLEAKLEAEPEAEPLEVPLEVNVGRLARLASLPWLYAKLPFLKRRIRRPVLERIDGVPLLVLPEVLNPVVFRSGAFLARTVATSPLAAPPEEGRVLDMGTGSGVGAIFAARRGFAGMGIDLNPVAVRCARANVLLNGLESRIEIREGNLFRPVAGERFDLVLFNPPFFRGEPRDAFDLAWRSTDVLERFAAGLPAALNPGGRALILLSTDGDRAGMAGMLRALTDQGLALSVAARRHFGSEIMTVYCAQKRQR
ncbi:MAG TPA: methyltransferase [Thermoanaerobaculia bacterium]|nr:methyltransferase [Thermoanaerobaculia bacterium]